jgi:predicted nucleotidyltransferase
MLEPVDLSRPHAIISRGVDADVLRALAGTSNAMTGRQVHRMVGRGSNRTVQLALDRLSSEGLVDMREQGRSKLYTFNDDHLASEAVLALVSLRGRLVDRLRSDLERWSPAPAHASLYGSAARGEGDVDSDIDILLVRPREVDPEDRRWRTQVGDLEAALPRWTGNPADISEVSEDELRQIVADESPIVAELRADGIVLKGPRFSTYVRSLG